MGVDVAQRAGELAEPLVRIARAERFAQTRADQSAAKAACFGPSVPMIGFGARRALRTSSGDDQAGDGARHAIEECCT